MYIKGLDRYSKVSQGKTWGAMLDVHFVSSTNIHFQVAFSQHIAHKIITNFVTKFKVYCLTNLHWAFTHWRPA